VHRPLIGRRIIALSIINISATTLVISRGDARLIDDVN